MLELSMPNFLCPMFYARFLRPMFYARCLCPIHYAAPIDDQSAVAKRVCGFHHCHESILSYWFTQGTFTHDNLGTYNFDIVAHLILDVSRVHTSNNAITSPQLGFQFSQFENANKCQKCSTMLVCLALLDIRKFGTIFMMQQRWQWDNGSDSARAT